MKRSYTHQRMGGSVSNMGSKLKTIGLLGLIIFLLITTIYVSQILKQESESTPTTIKKTKASSITYKRTVDITVPSPTPTPTPTPLQSVATPTSTPFPAIQSTTTTITPTQSPSPTQTITPTTASGVSVIPTPTPTEIVLAKIESASTPTLIPSVTITQTQNLPEVGWIKPAHILFLFAFSLIFFSLIY